jgi:hypothetical protein
MVPMEEGKGENEKQICYHLCDCYIVFINDFPAGINNESVCHWLRLPVLRSLGRVLQ